MPHIEKTGVKTIKEQLWQWEGVMHDPNIDGFNGWGCKQKIYEVYFYAKEMIENVHIFRRGRMVQRKTKSSQSNKKFLTKHKN